MAASYKCLTLIAAIMNHIALNHSNVTSDLFSGELGIRYEPFLSLCPHLYIKPQQAPFCYEAA